jgi:predicted ABC-type ATPase
MARGPSVASSAGSSRPPGAGDGLCLRPPAHCRRLAGPNGAGKTTFYAANLAPAGLRLVNADELARVLEVPAYDAAAAAGKIRDTLVEQRESFVFETVFSDPVGDKRAFLQRAAAGGYTVVLIFIGLSSAELSEERVAMRVLQGGHDVPSDKLQSRFGRTLENLRHAIHEVPHVLVYDNSDLAHPFRKVVEFEGGKPIEVKEPIPEWVPWKPKRRRTR